MADAARRIAAGEGVDGLSPGAMISAFRKSKHSLLIARTSFDALPFALRSVMGNGEFTGTATELFDWISHMEERNLLGSAAALRSALELERQAFLAVGVSGEIRQRGKQDRSREINYVGPLGNAPKRSVFGNC